MKRGRDSIVTISSVNSFLPDPAVIDYSVAKAALTNFSKALSKELGSAGNTDKYGQSRSRRDLTVAWPGRRLCHRGEDSDDFNIAWRAGDAWNSAIDSTIAFAKAGAMPKVKDPSNPWALFIAYLDITAQRATDTTLAKWHGRLGGADIFTFRNASTMIESLRVDYGVLGPYGIRK